MTRNPRPARHKLYRISVPKGATPQECAEQFRRTLTVFLILQQANAAAESHGRLEDGA